MSYLVSTPIERVNEVEVREYWELIRALLRDIKRTRGINLYRRCRSYCTQMEAHQYPVVISRLEEIANA